MKLVVSNRVTKPEGVPDEIEWPDDWRLPVAGDRVDFDASSYTIDRVIFDPESRKVYIRVVD